MPPEAPTDGQKQKESAAARCVGLRSSQRQCPHSKLVKKCQYTYTAASRPKLERGCELNVKVPGWGLEREKGSRGIANL